MLKTSFWESQGQSFKLRMCRLRRVKTKLYYSRLGRNKTKKTLEENERNFLVTQEKILEKFSAQKRKEVILSRKKDNPALSKHQRGPENAEMSQNILKMKLIGDLS